MFGGGARADEPVLGAQERWRRALQAPGWEAARLVAGLADYDPGGSAGELLRRLHANVPGKMWKALPSPDVVRWLMACRSCSVPAPAMPSGYSNGGNLISPDRRWIVRRTMPGEDGLPPARVFPTAGGEAITLPWASDWPLLDFLADSRLLVGGSRWQLWSLDPLRCEREGEVPNGQAAFVAANADGSRVAVHDREVLLVEGLRLPWPRQIFALEFSPDSRWLAVADSDGCQLVDPNGGVHPLPQDCHRNGRTSPRLAFSPDSRWLAVGHSYAHCPQVVLWDTETLEMAGVVDGFERGADQLLFTADGRHLVVVDGSHSDWHVFDLATGQARSRLSSSYFSDLRVTPDNVLVLAMGDNSVDFCGLDGQGLGTVPGGRDGVNWVGLDAQGMGVYSGDGTYREYRRAGEKPLGTWTDDDLAAAEAARAELPDPAGIRFMFGVGNAPQMGPETHIAWSFLIDMVRASRQ